MSAPSGIDSRFFISCKVRACRTKRQAFYVANWDLSNCRVVAAARERRNSFSRGEAGTKMAIQNHFCD